MSNSFSTKLGAHLRAARKARGWSMGDLAEACGLVWRYIQQIETGARMPSLLVICQLARTLGVPISQLVAGLETDIPMPNPRGVRLADRKVAEKKKRK